MVDVPRGGQAANVGWSEETSDSECVVRFDGINADVAEALEIARFAQGVKTPAEEDKGGAAFVRARYQRRVITPMRAVSLVLGFVLLVASQFVVDALQVESPAARMLVAIVCWGLGYAAVPLTTSILRKPTLVTPPRTADEVFILSFKEGLFELKGSQGASMSASIAEIRGFSSQMKRIAIDRRDGTSTRLPCVLKLGNAEVLAGRLTELALAQGSAYRGAL